MTTTEITAVSYEESLGEIAELCENRASTYDFLACLYRKEVDAALMAELSAMRFPASTGNESMDKGYRLLASYLSNAWENSVEELAVDFARSFLGNGIDSFSAAYPFESVYVSEKRLVMQDARDEVLAIYRAFGLDKVSSWREGEDHIALEMEFMKTLALRTAKACREKDAEGAMRLLASQHNFMTDHLGSWCPMFVADALRHAKTGFYQGLAHLTDGFIALDMEFLEEVCGEDEAAF